MKKTVLTLACVLFTAHAFAQDFDDKPPPVHEITKRVIRAVTNYGNAISCGGDVPIRPKDIAALVPYKTFADYLDAKYAVLWKGDIGCAGGSGTSTDNIATVTVGAFNTFVVDPTLSSPVIKFAPPGFVDRLVGNTHDSLILEGREFGPNDSDCCPSIKVRFTMRVDEKGNWKLVDKKTLSSKQS